VCVCVCVSVCLNLNLQHHCKSSVIFHSKERKRLGNREEKAKETKVRTKLNFSAICKLFFKFVRVVFILFKGLCFKQQQLHQKNYLV